MNETNKLRPNNKELHGIKPDPTTPRPPKPSSQNPSDNKYDELVSIALWAIRRLPTNQYKNFAYDELDKVTGQKWERV